MAKFIPNWNCHYWVSQQTELTQSETPPTVITNSIILSKGTWSIKKLFYISRMSIKRNSSDEQGSNPRKRATNFKTDEVIFFLHELKKRKMTLFGTLSPTPTFKLKMQTWLEVRNQLVDAGFPSRTNLTRNGRNGHQPLKPNTPMKEDWGWCNKVD